MRQRGLLAPGATQPQRPVVKCVVPPPARYSQAMLLPIKRANLRQLAEREADDDAAAFARETPERRLRVSLALIAATRRLARAAGAAWIVSPRYDLDEKARRYVAPLRRVKTA